EAHQRAAAAGPGGVEIAERIDLRPPDEPNVHPSLLQQAHDVIEPEARDRAGDVGWIAHGVDEGLRRPIPDDAVFEQPDGIGRMGSFGEPEAQQGKAPPGSSTTAVVRKPGITVRLGSLRITSSGTISSQVTIVRRAANAASTVSPRLPHRWAFPSRSARWT